MKESILKKLNIIKRVIKTMTTIIPLSDIRKCFRRNSNHVAYKYPLEPIGMEDLEDLCDDTEDGYDYELWLNIVDNYNKSVTEEHFGQKLNALFKVECIVENLGYKLEYLDRDIDRIYNKQKQKEKERIVFCEFCNCDYDEAYTTHENSRLHKKNKKEMTPEIEAWKKTLKKDNNGHYIMFKNSY